MSKGTKTPHLVIAATKDDTSFKAVALRRSDGSAELLWSRRMPAEHGTWSDFAAQCGVSTETGGPAAVVGLDSTAAVFYKISAPKVGKDETAAIVRMQAESLLPLPQDQIEVAWRSLPSTNGTVDVTIAAARRDYLGRLAEDVRAFDPHTILPACEGTVRAWQDLFGPREREALLLSIGARTSQLSLVSDGLVTNAAVLGTGVDDLTGADPDPASSSGYDAVLERFAHDIRTVLESASWKEASSRPLFVLSDGSTAMDSAIASLSAAGLNVKASLPKGQGLRVPAEFGAADIYDYRIPLGLALMRLDSPPRGLDLFERLAEAREQQKAKSAWYSTALAVAVALAMLAVLVAVTYFVDVASEKRLTALVEQPAFQQARERQTLLRTVARHRPDLLGLLTELSAGESNGIVLDEFYFKKGQLASITGRADNTEQMWKYQANLLEQKSLKDVEITNQSQDSKSKKITFTMVFHYKNFTKKGESL